MSKNRTLVQQLRDSCERQQKIIEEWEKEAIERGKDIEKIVQITSGCKHLMEEAVYDKLCEVLLPYIDRNTNETEKRRDRKKGITYV